MALYLETSPDTFEFFDGSQLLGDGWRINAVAAETLWSDIDLAAVGLYKPAEADAVLPGKMVVSTSVQRVEGEVKYVHELADAPLYIPSTPILYAVGNFHVDAENFNITGIETSVQFAAAMWMGPGQYFILLTEGQSDTQYIAKVAPTSGTAYVTDKGTDYMIVQAYDSTGTPADPADFSLEIVRAV